MTSSPAPADLAETLLRAARRLRREWASSLGPWDLSPHHARALRVVAELDRPRLGAVAERLHVTPRSATEVIDALEARGLVVRVPDEADRRAVRVVLTERGEGVRDEIAAARRAAAETCFAPLSDGERADLARLLARIDGSAR